METCNLPDEEFKVMVIKMLTELGRRVNGHSEEKVNTERENIRKYQREVRKLNNIITTEKYTREVQCWSR